MQQIPPPIYSTFFYGKLNVSLSFSSNAGSIRRIFHEPKSMKGWVNNGALDSCTHSFYLKYY